jgi:hypothetical protein
MQDQDDDSSTSQGSGGRPPAGLAVRAVPLVAAAALLVLGLTRCPFASETLAIGFALVALSGVLHALAVRFPRRYALDGFAWVSTMVAVLLALVVATAGGR